MEQVLFVIQFVANIGTILGGIGVGGYLIKALREQVSTKESQIDLLNERITGYQNKISELEKRTPEAIEGVLANRIHIREEEIKRLVAEHGTAGDELQAAQREITALQNDLARTRGFRAMLAIEGLEDVDLVEEITSLTGGTGEISVKLLGHAAVDSGMLMVTDPCYIDSEWQDQELQPLKAYIDSETGKTYHHFEDFVRFDEPLPGFAESVSDAISNGRLVEEELEREKPFPYSFRGAANASYADIEAGEKTELVFQHGGPGAGVVFRTGFGDGVYPVYGEMIDGRVVRIYVNTA